MVIKHNHASFVIELFGLLEMKIHFNDYNLISNNLKRSDNKLDIGF